MESLIKPFVYIGIIFLAIILKKAGLFGERDHRVLSKVFMNVTFPATIVNVFVGFSADSSLYFLIVLGLVFGLIPLILMYCFTAKKPVTSRAFCMLNASGSNVGGFVLPIIQLFFGATGAAISCVFDIGNALIMAGGSYAFTSSMLRIGNDEKSGIGHAIGSFLKKIFSSITIDAYLIMLALMLCNIHIPEVVGNITGPFANANGFISMFMIGLMFKVDKNPGKLKDLLQTLVFRIVYGVALAMIVYFVLPFDELVRQIAALCIVGPAGSMAPVFTEKIGSDASLSSFMNSLSILCSFVIMLVLVYVVF